MSFFFCNVVHVLCCFGERFAGSSHPLSKYLSSVWIYIIAIFWHLEEALDFSTSKSHNRIVLNNILNKTDTWNLYFSLQHLWKSWKLFKVWLQLLNNSLHWITVWICWVFQTDVQKYTKIYKNALSKVGICEFCEFVRSPDVKFYLITEYFLCKELLFKEFF